MRRRQARELNEAALKGLVDALGPDHEYSFTSALNLVGDLAALGRLHEVCELGEDTLWRLRAFFGPDYVMTLIGVVNLILDLQTCGVDADALYQDTSARYAKLPAQHSDRLLAESGRRIDWDFDPPPL